MRFCTYGIIEPSSGHVIYVGQTGGLQSRLKNHFGCDPGCGTYKVVYRLRSEGKFFDYCVFGRYEDRLASRRLERALILCLPDLLNSKTNGLLSPSKYPLGAEDDRLVEMALNPYPEVLPYGLGVAPPMIHKPWAYVSTEDRDRIRSEMGLSAV